MTLIPLGQIVRDKLIEDGRSTLHKFEKNLALGVRAARQLKIDVKGQIKTVFLKPTPWGTIRVPDDYFDYSKVGVCVGGTVYNLTVNNDLCFPHHKNDCGQLLPERYATYYNGGFDDYLPFANAVGFGYWYYNWWNENGEFVGKLYGVGQGWSPFGQYRYDENNREFVVTPQCRGREICLEYATTAINNAQVLIPEVAVEYAVTFIKWKDARGGEREQYRAEHHLAEQKLRISEYSFSLDEMIDTIRHSYVLSPKG